MLDPGQDPDQSSQHEESGADRRSFIRSIVAGTGASLFGFSGCTLAPGNPRSRRNPRRKDPLARSREYFTIEPGLTYLNTGSLGCSPRPVFEAVVKAMRAVNANPTRVHGTDLLQVTDAVRNKAARLLGAAPGEVAVVRNTTEGMTIVAAGLSLRQGDEILINSKEHSGSFFCWKYLSERIGVRIRMFTPPAPPTDPEQLVELVKNNLTPATRVVSICHMAGSTGLVYPLKAISEAIRSQGIFLVVDGAHPPGMMQVNLRDLGVDTYASSSHKWLCAPRGTGLLYVRKEVQDEIRPLIAGSERYRLPDARRYEAVGCRNLEGQAGLEAAIDFYDRVGPGRIEARVRHLSTRLRRSVREMPGVRLLTSEDPGLSCGISTIGFKIVDCRKVQAALREHFNIWVKPLPEPDLNAIRVSTHYYNTSEEVDGLVNALKTVVQE